MHYGSGFHILSILFILMCVFGVWAILRRCSLKIQRLVILGFMLLNILQHFLKPHLYPHYAGMGFSHLQTAYNVCAFLIIISPAVFMWGNRLLRNFLYLIGTVAGMGTIVFPVWYIGMDVSALGWDYARFYTCHGLLFMSSLLPLLLNHHKPSYKEFWHVGLGFLLTLVFVLANNVIFISAGLYAGADIHNIYGSLWIDNPCMLMGPPDSLSWLTDVVRIFTPSVFLRNNTTGTFAPILWYALPVYLAISIVTAFIFAAIDRKNLSKDLCRLIKKQ